MLTRRVRGQWFLLRPSERTNQIIRYVVAVMARKWKIELHAITAMSNHWHICLTDSLGNVVKFQRDCHAFVARGLNASHGDFESVWSSEQTSRVECVEPSDLIKEVAYTMANPVEAGLVRYGKSWPGVRHAWPHKPIEIARPPKFFRGKKKGGRWPETAVLEFSRPPRYEELSDDELAAVIADAIEHREAKIRREFDAAGRTFLGSKAVLAQRRYARPGTRGRRFNLSPKVACRDKERRIQRLRADKEWRVVYEGARKRWIAGDREVLFPYGTYKMRVIHGAACDPPPG